MEQKPQIVISKMTENDVPFVALLEKECFSSPWSERSLLESLENEGSVFLCASIGGKREQARRCFPAAKSSAAKGAARFSALKCAKATVRPLRFIGKRAFSLWGRGRISTPLRVKTQ